MLGLERIAVVFDSGVGGLLLRSFDAVYEDVDAVDLVDRVDDERLRDSRRAELDRDGAASSNSCCCCGRRVYGDRCCDGCEAMSTVVCDIGCLVRSERVWR